MSVLTIWGVLLLICSTEEIHWSLNAVFNVTQTAIHSSNLSDCFVCVAGPSNIHQGFPLEAEPLRTEAWLVPEAATIKTDRVETLHPYEIAVSHTAALCYASEHGTIELGRYPHCAVTVVIKRMGFQKGRLLSRYPVSKCHSDVNVTLWQHIILTADLWVTNYGAVTHKAANCSSQRLEHLRAMNETPAGVLIASIETHFTVVRRPVLMKAGWFFLCGDGAYKALPFNWTGSCTLGTIRPALEVLHRRHRMKRADNPLVTRSSGWWTFVRFFYPSFGVMELETALVNISIAMERFANYTSRGMSAMQEEIRSISAFTYQNRLALDFLLIKSGGVCRTLNVTCCFLVDKTGEIATDIEHIRKQAALFHEIGLDSAVDLGAVAKWMRDVFGINWSGWLMRILITIVAVCLVFMIVRQCVTLCLHKLCALPQEHMYPMQDLDTEGEFHRLAQIDMGDGDCEIGGCTLDARRCVDETAGSLDMIRCAHHNSLEI